MPADDAPHEALVAEVVQPALLAVALAGGVDEGQVVRLADAVGTVPGALEEPLFQRDGDVLGKPDADEAARGDRVARADELHRVGRRHRLAVVHRAQRPEALIGIAVHGTSPAARPRSQYPES